MNFNEKGFVKIKSKYNDTIILCKLDWIARQAARKGHLAYSVEELEEVKQMPESEQELWHDIKKIFGGHYVGTLNKTQ